jgi:hypothetical protein
MVDLLTATVGRITFNGASQDYFSLFITPEGKAVCEQHFRDASIRMAK